MFLYVQVVFSTLLVFILVKNGSTLLYLALFWLIYSLYWLWPSSKIKGRQALLTFTEMLKKIDQGLRELALASFFTSPVQQGGDFYNLTI